jgi:hypothetical protein
LLTDVSFPTDREVVRKEAENSINIQRPVDRNITHVECEGEDYTDNWCSWKLIPTISKASR